MHDILSNATFFGVMVSILSYELGLFIKKKTQSPICNPLLISIIVTMGVRSLACVCCSDWDMNITSLCCPSPSPPPSVWVCRKSSAVS